jgi:hypothetical protein
VLLDFGPSWSIQSLPDKCPGSSSVVGYHVMGKSLLTCSWL